MHNADGAKKILIINASPRRSASSTMQVTNAFVKGMCDYEPYLTETVVLSDEPIKPCMGCLSCWGRTEGTCIIQDDAVGRIRRQVEQADVVICSFPLYFFGMPGTMKVFLDRMLGMMCTYRGQQPPQDGQSYHGIRIHRPGQKLVLISGCAYSETTSVYDSLLKQFDCICGKDHYTALLCPQLKTLVELGAGSRLNRYLSRFEQAGMEFAQQGSLTPERLEALSKPPFSEQTYQVLLDGYWKEQKEHV